MTANEERTELVRRWRAIDPMGGGGGFEVYAVPARSLADALEASEAEKQRLIEAVRLVSDWTTLDRDAVYELRRACDEAEQ